MSRAGKFGEVRARVFSARNRVRNTARSLGIFVLPGLIALVAAPMPAFALLLPTTTALSSSANPSTVGASVTFTATVSHVVLMPTGTVTFKDGATTLGTGTLNGSGQATLTTSALAVGGHSITAAYGGDIVYNPSTSSALSQTVNQNTTTTTLGSTPNPGAFGSSVTFTANVSSAFGTRTGSVTFKDGAATLGTGTLDGTGQATFSTSALAIGGHSISAVYGGDTNDSGSISSALTQTVNQASSSTAVASSANPSTFGASVTFTATVSSAGGTPTGTVTFKDGAATLGTGTLNGGGQATLTTSSLAIGGRSITAVYGGDTNFAGSTSSVLTQTVNQAASSTAVASSANPSTFGVSVTFTATVSSAGGTPTGTVTFKDGAATLGTGTLNGGGQATLTTSSLAISGRSITAVYGGDTNFAGSTSSVLTQTVNQAASSTAVASSANPSTFGASVTFTATVSSSGGVPTGTVTFKDGAATLGTGTLNGSGQATLTTSAFAIGGHSITAVYGGDTNYTGSTSAALTQTVNQASSSTAVASSANPSTFGASVTFTATVSSSGGTPTGTVTFKDGAATLGTGTLNGGGQATLTTSAFAIGGHSITAVYGGDTNYTGSTSAALTQTINQAASSAAVASSANPSTFDAPVTLTATVTGPGTTPAGTVTFKDGAATLGTGTLNGSGQATLTTSALAIGGHSITAVYGGDTNYTGSTSSALTQTVNQASSSTAVASSANPAAFGTPVTFTATVTGPGTTPTGSVTFRDGAATLGTGTLNGSGQATFATGALALGNHSITAVYGGDGNFTGSTSSALAQTVNQNSSSTALGAVPNPSSYGASVTFTASVTSSGGTPTGMVTFKDGAATLGTRSLNGSGQATFSTASLAGGGHSISAVYGGDADFTGSTSPALTQTVNPASSSTGVAASANPATFGAPVTLTATVTGGGGTASGTVTFKDGATTLGTGTLDGSAQATLTTSALAVGNHSISAVYAGDSNYAGSTSSVLTLAVNQSSSTTALASSANPGAVGAAVTFTADVTVSGSAATGTVTFKDGATSLGTGTLNGSGRATFTTSALALGSHSITASYGGDGNYTGSTSPALAETINASASTTALASSANPSIFGSPVTFTATVSGPGSPPTGSVTFKDGATSLGTGTLNGGGQAVFTTSALGTGSHSISAVYGGDGMFSSSTSAALTQAVNQASSSAAVAASVNPATFGTPVTLTATVTGAGGTPSGTVTFKDGAATLGTGTLNGGGQATLTTGALTTGSHSVTVIYGGDSNFTGSTSSALALAVNQNSSSTALVSSVNPGAAGAAVTFTATVTASGGAATGTVTFKDGATSLGTGSLNGSGQASLTTSALALGNHSMTAVYGGDGNYTGSTSPVLTEAVNANASTTTLASSASPAAFGASVTFTSTVAGSSLTPTGIVTFKDGATTLGTIALNGSGQAAFTSSALSAGNHSITAVYGGDATYGGSGSSALTEAIGQNASATSLTSSANPAAAGTPVTLSATVTGSGGIPTGSVTFKDGAAVLGTGTLNGTGLAALTLNSFAGGNHAISAVYGGDGNFLTGTSPPLTLVVNQNSSTIGLASSANPAASGSPVTFTATVIVGSGTPTGMITFKDGATSLGTVALDGGGHASMTAASLGNGMHPMTAAYNGDGNFLAGVSPVLSQGVVQSATTTTLTSSLNPSIAGQVVTFTAAVASAGGNPAGTVIFRDGGAVIGTVALTAGSASLSISSLVSGTHSMTAAYGGNANFTASTSAVLIQSVNLPADSLKLRALQIAATRINAQNSGAAVSGAMAAAVAEGLSEDCGQIIGNDGGIRFNSGCGGPADARTKRGFADNRPKWMAWAEFTNTNVNLSPSSGGAASRQLNGLAGLTYRLAPDLVTGFLGGYESFSYIQQSLNGQLRGDGWTAGAYLGWRMTQGLRFDAGAAFSRIGFSGIAGTASGAFPAQRILLTAGLTGSYKFSSRFELEPSARIYALFEHEDNYVDSLGTRQAQRSFSDGRASTGIKLSYHTQWSDLAVTPFMGLYADYYFTRDDTGTVLPPTPALDGASGRIVSGISLATKGGAQFTVSGEFGGLGGSFETWSVRARAAVPF